MYVANFVYHTALGTSTVQSGDPNVVDNDEGIYMWSVGLGVCRPCQKFGDAGDHSGGDVDANTPDVVTLEGREIPVLELQVGRGFPIGTCAYMRISMVLITAEATVARWQDLFNLFPSVI